MNKFFTLLSVLFLCSCTEKLVLDNEISTKSADSTFMFDVSNSTTVFAERGLEDMSIVAKTVTVDNGVVVFDAYIDEVPVKFVFDKNAMDSSSDARYDGAVVGGVNTNTYIAYLNGTCYCNGIRMHYDSFVFTYYSDDTPFTIGLKSDNYNFRIVEK